MKIQLLVKKRKRKIRKIDKANLGIPRVVAVSEKLTR